MMKKLQGVCQFKVIVQEYRYFKIEKWSVTCNTITNVIHFLRIGTYRFGFGKV